MDAGERSVPRVSLAILSYLCRNERARDTLEGVVQWWLLDQSITDETVLVKQALADLTAQGLLIEEKDRDSRSHYQLNQARLPYIQALVKSKRKTSGGERMSSTIKNISRQLMTIELSNRNSLHLAPNEASRPLKDYEVNNNKRIQRMLELGLIELRDEGSQTVESGGDKEARGGTTPAKAGRGSESGERKARS